jgi:hypothetical protein
MFGLRHRGIRSDPGELSRRRSALGQYLVSLLYGITSYDPVTVGLVLMVLAFASTLAGLIPTVRAITINPITALRE